MKKIKSKQKDKIKRRKAMAKKEEEPKEENLKEPEKTDDVVKVEPLKTD